MTASEPASTFTINAAAATGKFRVKPHLGQYRTIDNIYRHFNSFAIQTIVQSRLSTGKGTYMHAYLGSPYDSPLVVLDNVKVRFPCLGHKQILTITPDSFRHTMRSFSSHFRMAPSVAAKSLKSKERKPLSRYSRARRVWTSRQHTSSLLAAA
jgi:hypothetical protein